MREVDRLNQFYNRAFGTPVEPYPYQRRLAEDPTIDVLIAPTALGKTAAVTLGWAWRRLTFKEPGPRRLVWCLPMRTLVEQTAREAARWMQGVAVDFEQAQQPVPTVHILMGGRVESDWRIHPEMPAILVGTQDMLLSRALMRGYGMSRFGWPIDFGLLHTDALWVFDEVQLMGAARATSTQLEAFRRMAGWRHIGLSRSLWVSATLDPKWLNTTEFREEIPSPVVLSWNDDSPPESAVLAARLDAIKRLRRADTSLTADGVRKPEVYARALAREVVDAHQSGTTTLVIVNTVRRAQALYAALAEAAPHVAERLLIHSRYRPPDRRALEERLRTGVAMDRIIVATQAVEAGVDMTSAVLFTELAPWSSLVQRFGRCNRAGELNAWGGAEVRWIDIEAQDNNAAAQPYELDALRAAREIVSGLEEVSPRNLPPPSPPSAPAQVIRPKDFEELFDTDADLSGYDLDISPFIRDGDDISVSLFWRTFEEDVSIETLTPTRDELCPAPIADVRKWMERKPPGRPAMFLEDPNARGKGWIRFDLSRHRLRPGMTILIEANSGGYADDTGFDPEVKTPVTPVPAKSHQLLDDEVAPGARTDEDTGSHVNLRIVLLDDHQGDARDTALALAEVLGLREEGEPLVRAAAWHDAGKAHDEMQRRLGNAEHGAPLAKSLVYTRKGSKRPYFRHELASALAFLGQHDGEPDADLVAFLIAAHHGKIRMGLRALPDERPTDPALRIARGVQDGDRLPAIRCGDEISDPVILELGLMEMGEDEHGRPSWSARTQRLLTKYGPFRLAYAEALIRMIDWRASAAEQLVPCPNE
jgi:CRISPR-associated endonuclease/helicase Cas3